MTPIGKLKKTVEYCHGRKLADQRNTKLISEPVHLRTKFKITTEENSIFKFL